MGFIQAVPEFSLAHETSVVKVTYLLLFYCDYVFTSFVLHVSFSMFLFNISSVQCSLGLPTLFMIPVFGILVGPTNVALLVGV